MKVWELEIAWNDHKDVNWRDKYMFFGIYTNPQHAKHDAEQYLSLLFGGWLEPYWRRFGRYSNIIYGSFCPSGTENEVAIVRIYQREVYQKPHYD